MKTRVITILLSLFLVIRLNAQESDIDTTIKLDLLKSPSSPAFNLLGISPSLIERPSDITEFRLSLQNATTNFSIPDAYAVELAPFLMKRKKYLLNTFNDNKYTIPQTFVVSAGYSRLGPDGGDDVDSLKTTKLAFGIKFSIKRPGWTGQTEKVYDSMIKLQKLLLNAYEQISQSNAHNEQVSVYKVELKSIIKKPSANWTDAEKQRATFLTKAIDSLEVLIGNESNEAMQELRSEVAEASEVYQKLKATASSFTQERKGFFIDFASGIVVDFPANRFDNSRTSKAGAWLTMGNENGNKGITSLFILRYLYQPESIFADPQGNLSTDKVSTFDAGGRLLINGVEGRFALSSELLYRSVLGKSDLEPSWRFVMNAEYALWKNQKLSFAFGRNFDGTISKGGNLIAALNFVAGLGSTRKVATKEN